MSEIEDNEKLFREKLNLETAQIPWVDLQKHFAGGHTINVNDDLDLVDVAFQIVKDNKADMEKWVSKEKVKPVTDVQAQQWYEDEAVLWAVVIKPWILVQYRKDSTTEGTE